MPGRNQSPSPSKTPTTTKRRIRYWADGSPDINENVAHDKETKLQTSDNQHVSGPDTKSASADAEYLSHKFVEHKQASTSNNERVPQDLSSDSQASGMIASLWSSLPFTRSSGSTANTKPPIDSEEREETGFEDEEPDSYGEEVPLISDEDYRVSRSMKDPISEIAKVPPNGLSEMQQKSPRRSAAIQADDESSVQIPKEDQLALTPDDGNVSEEAAGKVGIATSIFNTLTGAKRDPVYQDTPEDSGAIQEVHPADPESIDDWLEKVPYNSTSTKERLPEDPSQRIEVLDQILYEETQNLPLTDGSRSEQSKGYVSGKDVTDSSFDPYLPKHSEQPRPALGAASPTTSEEFSIRNSRTPTPPSRLKLRIRNRSVDDNSDVSKSSPNTVSGSSSSDGTSDKETGSDTAQTQFPYYPDNHPKDSDGMFIRNEGQLGIAPANLDKLRENGISNRKVCFRTICNCYICEVCSPNAQRQDEVKSYLPDFGDNEYISPEQFKLYKEKVDQEAHRSNARALRLLAKWEKEKLNRSRERARRKQAEKKLRYFRLIVPPPPAKEQPDPDKLDKDRGLPNVPELYEDEDDRPQSEKGGFPYSNFNDKITEMTVKTLLLRAQIAFDDQEFQEAESIAIEAKNLARELAYKPLEARAWFWKGQAELARGAFLNAEDSFERATPCVGVYTEGDEVDECLELARKRERLRRGSSSMQLRVLDTPERSMPDSPMEPESAVNRTDNLMDQLGEMDFDEYDAGFSRSNTLSNVNSPHPRLSSSSVRSNSNSSLNRFSPRPSMSNETSTANSPLSPSRHPSTNTKLNANRPPSPWRRPSKNVTSTANPKPNSSLLRRSTTNVMPKTNSSRIPFVRRHSSLNVVSNATSPSSPSAPHRSSTNVTSDGEKTPQNVSSRHVPTKGVRRSPRLQKASLAEINKAGPSSEGAGTELDSRPVPEKKRSVTFE